MAADWTTHLLHSLADQAGTWFVGVVLALLGLFSGKLVETVKFALNRADLRAKYYEQLALDLSGLVFLVDRLAKVYYGAEWANDDDKGAIAVAYNDAMNKICSEEYVYLSWLQRYWNKRMVDAFGATMKQIREVDTVVIRLNEAQRQNDPVKESLTKSELTEASGKLRQATHTLLVTAIQ
jgi:hypothetical protein